MSDYDCLLIGHNDNGLFSANLIAAAGRDGAETHEKHETYSKEDRCLSGGCIVEKLLRDRLESAYGVDLSTIVLSAYSTLLLRLYSREDITIVTSPDEKEVFPLQLFSLWDSSFRESVRSVRQKIRRAAAHRLYAAFVLTNPLRMNEYGVSRPGFEVAYLTAETGDASLEERLNFYPGLYREVGLVLRVIEDKNTRDTRLQFRYSPRKYEPGIIEKLSRHLASILEEVGGNPDIMLKEIVPDPGA